MCSSLFEDMLSQSMKCRRGRAPQAPPPQLRLCIYLSISQRISHKCTLWFTPECSHLEIRVISKNCRAAPSSDLITRFFMHMICPFLHFYIIVLYLYGCTLSIDYFVLPFVTLSQELSCT